MQDEFLRLGFVAADHARAVLQTIHVHGVFVFLQVNYEFPPGRLHEPALALPPRTLAKSFHRGLAPEDVLDLHPHEDPECEQPYSRGKKKNSPKAISRPKQMCEATSS